MVQELAGPVAGLESQNWTCKTCPCASVQHVFCTLPVLWQLSGAEAEHADTAATAEPTIEPRAINRDVV